MGILLFMRKLLSRLASRLKRSLEQPHHLDFVFGASEGALFIGWALSPTSRLTVDVRVPGDASPARRATSIRYFRHDVSRQFGKGEVDMVRYGFVAFLRLPDAAELPPQVTIDLTGDGGYRVSTVAPLSADLTPERRQQLMEHWPHISGLVYQLAGAGAVTPSAGGPVARDELEFIKSALMLLSPSSPRLQQLMDQHFGPLIEGVWKSRPRQADAPLRKDFGLPPTHPRVSVLVPLYGRYDFVQHQLALFANDPTWRDIELIYIVDDPEIEDLVVQRAHHLYPVFGVSFSMVYCGQNQGFSGANNLGARMASGEFLILMNSDVMPAQPGWVQAFVEAFSALPDAGILGCKLLYEDGSLQHAGMSLEPHADWDGLPVNHHPGKGLPDSAADGEPFRATAVTAACMAIRRALYLQLGGLDEGYIIGDFEDSDLCLRAARQGINTYVVPTITLYHLERQSQSLVPPGGWKHKLTLFNCWRHARRHLGVEGTRA